MTIYYFGTCRSKSPEPGSIAPRDGSRLGSYGGPSEVSPARTYQGPLGPYSGPSGSDRDDTNRSVGGLERWVFHHENRKISSRPWRKGKCRNMDNTKIGIKGGGEKISLIWSF